MSLKPRSAYEDMEDYGTDSPVRKCGPVERLGAHLNHEYHAKGAWGRRVEQQLQEETIREQHEFLKREQEEQLRKFVINDVKRQLVPVGIGGAPTRATTLPKDPEVRKTFPIASGVLDYFPDALLAIAEVSFAGNEQHNPGKPLHWDRSKSQDEPDAMLRHFLQRGTFDSDGKRHSAKMAWRCLALLQKEIEEERMNLSTQEAA